MPTTVRKPVPAASNGLRVDRFLASWEEIGSRAKAARLIDEGRVTIHGRTVKASTEVQTDDVVDVVLPDAASSELVPYDIPLELLHEDDDVIVVNKPSGLVVHPAAGHAGDTLVNALLSHAKGLAMGFGEERPGIVHRLDKETSGLLVVAKNDHAQENLVRQFQARTITRSYQALVFGELRPASGTVQSYLARHSTDRKRFASVIGADRKIQRTEAPPPSTGKWAVTDYRTLAFQRGLSFMEIRLRTGRTHQIRVHFSELGHPLVGDSVYGGDRRITSLASIPMRRQIQELDRFLLHARELGFKHPRTGQDLHFVKEWPAEDLDLLREWGFIT